MHADDGQRFRDLMRGMGRMFGAEPDALVLDAYWIALSDWAYAELEVAARQLMRTAKFMPRPADFDELRRAGEQTAAEAWANVLTNVRCGDYRNGITVGGRADRVVRAMGGYTVLGMSNTSETHFREKRFTELWEQLGHAEEVRATLPNLSAGRSSRPTEIQALLTKRGESK